MMIFTTIILALALTAYAVYLFVPQWDSWLRRARKKVGADGRVCCLTFDDGPSQWTPQVLDILKSNRIRATFFITGERAGAHPHIVKRISDEGHAIGSHTMTHKKLTFCSPKTVRREIEQCSQTIKSITGLAPYLFRAPHGFKPLFMRIKRSPSPRPSPTRGEGEKNIPSPSRGEGEGGDELTLIPWTKGIWDTDMPPAEELLKRVAKRFDPLEILLLHDGIDNRAIPQNRDSMVAALPNIIDEYRKRGYKFATISELREMPAKPARRET